MTLECGGRAGKLRRLYPLLAPMAAVVLLGACSPGADQGTKQGVISNCSSYISWQDAGDHIGETATIRGPVAGTRYASDSNGQPTFLNVGVDYPNPDRFVVLIWGENRGEFPE